MTSLLLALPLLVAAQDVGAYHADDQVAWQRSLADARAVAAAEGRPILVAVNIDGESASDRIVRERYRDPDFVAWTRRFVCVVGHPFRHGPRDRDDSGRRIECPRLGIVTCGEHVAAEPELYDAFLGGERVSPRHALILPDGTKLFDLFLLFDMRELDAALADAAHEAPPFEPPRAIEGPLEAVRTHLAGGRSSWQRMQFEAFVCGEIHGEDEIERAHFGTARDFVRAIRSAGDAGSIDALMPLLVGRPIEASFAEDVVTAARERGFGPELAAALRGVLAGAGVHPGSPALGRDRGLVALLARSSAGDASQRAFLVALAATAPANDRAAARTELARVLARDDLERVDAAIVAEGGPVDVEDLLRLGAELAGAPAPAPTIPPAPGGTLDELLDELEAADAALAGNEADPAAQRRFGLSNLRLALARIASSGPDIALLLQDAERWLGRAALHAPADDLLALERARTAFWLSRFDEQSRLAGEVLTRARARTHDHDAGRAVITRWSAWGSGVPSGRAEAERAARIAFDDVAHEALRWIGDAEGRRVVEVHADPALQAGSLVRGARALASACASPLARDVDYQSLASFLHAHGLTRPSLSVVRAGLERLPASNALRDLARDLFARSGRPDALCSTADWLAALEPDSAASAWYAGYAWFLRAEWSRRGQRPRGAIRDYDESTRRFARSIELEPAFGDSARHYLAAAEMGRGFAHRAAGRRQDAADSLARALAISPAIGDASDGLDRTALDLVDAAFEWTEEEQQSPVNPTAFADALSRAVPGEARWLRAVSDACLREGLRADGRVGRTVALPAAMRAAGQPDEMREPCELGDWWLEHAIEIAARARAVTDDEESRRFEAQACAVHAERLLVRDRDSEAARLLVAAARLLEEPVPEDLDLLELARALRERLGDARPIARPGR